jgi:protein-L-isoaspartate(D-aspartate) O-methyltransferase
MHEAVPQQARVEAAMARVRRRDVLKGPELRSVEHDAPIPIGFGQTTSQPSLIAQMVSLLELRPGARVLEVGTGCGYQTAVLARLVNHVFTIERISPLLEKTKARLASLSILNVTLKCADGNFGWSQFSPFDGILITAAAPQVPPALVKQLSEGGILVVPEGANQQVLRVYRKTGDKLEVQNLEAVRFVPLLDGVER